MRLKLLSTILVSASMIASPVLAAAAAQGSAAKLSLAGARAGAANGESDLAEGSGGIIAIALVAGIVAIGVLAAIESSDDNDDPISA